MSEVILVGGSKNGLVTDGAVGMNSVNNIVLNEDLTGPEYVDRYVPTGVKDRDGRDVYAHVGRYTAEESESYWEKLDKDQVEDLINQTKAEREAEAQLAAEEAEQAAEDAKAKIETPEAVDQTKAEAKEVVTPEKEEPTDETKTDESTEEAPAEVEEEAKETQ